MMAAGYTPAASVATEAATWVAQGYGMKKGYEWYYGNERGNLRGTARRPENKNLNTYNMSGYVPYQGGKKRHHQHTNSGYPSAPLRRKKYKPNPRHNVMYNRNNDLDQKFCVVKRHAEAFVPASGDSFMSISCAELSTSPSWTYYSGLFNRYKLEWIKVTIHQSADMMVIYSFASVDSTDAPTTIAEVLKHANARKHDTCQDRYSPSRTLEVKKSQAFADYLDCNDIGADLGSVTGTRGSGSTPFSITGGNKKCMIGLATKGVGSRTINLTIEFGIRFIGMNDAANVT
jgi:hypothetical protein